jgi:DNA-binding transcriptional regulator YhcF (GntR family)
MTDQRDGLIETLRSRVLRSLQAGTVQVGDRLPSARDLGQEFKVDYRLVLDAYRALAAEGLVELRNRGGIYVAAQPRGAAGLPPLPERWFAEILTEALNREIPSAELHEWLRRLTETLRLRAVAISTSTDQIDGLCRELRDDFGLEADGFVADEVQGAQPPPLAVRRADLIVTTTAHAAWVRPLADELRKHVIVIDVRPDLLGGEWALLLRRPVYVVVATADFEQMLRSFYAAVPGIENLRTLVFGRDDLTTIPPNAPTYITQRVRSMLADVPIRGRILPAARTIASTSAREIFEYIVRANLEALAARRQ